MSSLVGTDVVVRPARHEDAEACGRICYEAFRAIAEHHGFPPDFPAPETAIGVIADLLAHPGFHGVVAEHDGVILGSNFLDERCHVAGLGPITVHPAAQDARVGRRLMLALLDRARERDFLGAAYSKPPITCARSACTQSSASTSAKRSRQCRALRSQSRSTVALSAQRSRPISPRATVSATRCTDTTGQARLPMRSVRVRRA